MSELRQDHKNNIVGFHNTVGNVEALNRMLKTVNQNTPASTEGARLPFLSLNQDDGSFAYGPERIQTEEGSVWAVDIFDIKRGFISWAATPAGRKQNGEVLRSLDDLPNGSDLPAQDENGNPTDWQPGVSMNLLCISGEDAGESAVYKNNSRGGNKGVDELLATVSRRPSDNHPIPLVELKSSSYTNKKYGRKVVEPVFEVVDWATTGRVSLKTGELAYSPEATNDNVAPETKEIEAPTTSARRKRRSQSAA